MGIARAARRYPEALHVGDGNAQISASTANEAHCEISSIVRGCPEFQFHPLRAGEMNSCRTVPAISPARRVCLCRRVLHVGDRVDAHDFVKTASEASRGFEPNPGIRYGRPGFKINS